MSISRDKLHRLIFADYPYVVRPARPFRRLHASKKEKKICVLHFNIPKASVLTRMVIAISRSVYTPALSARNPRSRAAHTHTQHRRAPHTRVIALSLSLCLLIYTAPLSALHASTYSTGENWNGAAAVAINFCDMPRGNDITRWASERARDVRERGEREWARKQEWIRSRARAHTLYLLLQRFTACARRDE